MLKKLERLKKSFQYAGKGLLKVFQEEQNIRIQTITAIVAIFFAVYYKIERVEWMFLIFSIILVLLMEVLNSAIERVADVFKPRISTYVKEIKDIMAGSVLLSSMLAIIIGIIIFYPYIFP